MSRLVQSLDDDDVRLQKLLAWAKSCNIWIHDDIEIRRSSSPHSSKLDDNQQDESRAGNNKDAEAVETAIDQGFGAYVKHGKVILERQVVVLVSKANMLSARTTSLAPYIPREMLYTSEASSGLLLTLVLQHELMLGENGPWWGYLQSLPTVRGKWGVTLPLCMSREDEDGNWKWLNASETGRMVKRAETDPEGRIEGLGMSVKRALDFFKMEGISILERAHPDLLKDKDDQLSAGASRSNEKMRKQRLKDLSDDFLSAFTIISSRTFVVDMYHGLCMVPIADMFNHSDQANTHFEADDEVCDECGSLGSCPHNSDPLPSEAYGRPSSIMKAESGPNSEGWEPPDQLKGVDTVDMVAQEEIDSREQLFSTYGNFTNANLLTTYGFGLEWETEWERYVWEWRYSEEREDLVNTFESSASLASKAMSEKSTIYRRKAWARCCAHFTELPESNFAELLVDRSESVFPALQDSTRLTLPINSPFVALTKPAKAPTEELASGLGDLALDDFIAELSTHDESKDMYQPLFVDSKGRISLALWRAAVLYSYSTWKDNDPTLAFGDIGCFLSITESRLDQALNDDLPRSIRGEMEWIWILLHDVVSTLKRLVCRRLKQIERHRGHVLEEDADDTPQTILARILETSFKEEIYRSALIQSYQETSALRYCSTWLGSCCERIMKMEQYNETRQSLYQLGNSAEEVTTAQVEDTSTKHSSSKRPREVEEEEEEALESSAPIKQRNGLP